MRKLILLSCMLLLAKVSYALVDTEVTSPNINNEIYVDGVFHETIQDAIDALPVSGGTIIIPPGEYILTQPLSFPGSGSGTGNFRLMGSGKNNTKISTLDNIHLIQVGTPGNYTNRVDRITISDMTIEGNGTAGKCLFLTHTHYSEFRNLVINGCSDVIYLDYAWSNHFEEVEAYNATDRVIAVLNNSNANHFEKVHAGSGAVTANYMVEVSNSDDITFDMLITEGSHTLGGILIHNKSHNVNLNGWYYETAGVLAMGGPALTIGGSIQSTRNISVHSGWLWTNADSTNFNDMIRILNESYNVTIENVHMEVAGAGWFKSFVYAGPGPIENVNLINNTMVSTGTATSYNIASGVVGFTSKANRLVNVLTGTNSATQYFVDTGALMTTDKSLDIGTNKIRIDPGLITTNNNQTLFIDSYGLDIESANYNILTAAPGQATVVSSVANQTVRINPSGNGWAQINSGGANRITVDNTGALMLHDFVSCASLSTDASGYLVCNP